MKPIECCGTSESAGLSATRDDRGLVTVTMNNGKINILESGAVQRLTSCVEALSQDKSVRCLVLRGNDRAFVGGADINEMAALNPESARNFIAGLHRLCASVHDTPFPVIARINGWCFGVGVELAAACDIRVGSSASFYAMPEVKIGIPSVIQATLLPQLIGAGRTRGWLLTGRRVGAATALDWGFLTDLAEPDELDECIESIVAEILECPPNTIRLQKKLCNAWEQDFPNTAAEASIDVFGEAYETSEPSSAMHHFLQSRNK